MYICPKPQVLLDSRSFLICIEIFDRLFARYFPGNAAGVPTVAVAVVARVLPNYVLDFITEVA